MWDQNASRGISLPQVVLALAEKFQWPSLAVSKPRARRTVARTFVNLERTFFRINIPTLVSFLGLVQHRHLPYRNVRCVVLSSRSVCSHGRAVFFRGHAAARVSWAPWMFGFAESGSDQHILIWDSVEVSVCVRTLDVILHLVDVSEGAEC